MTKEQEEAIEYVKHQIETGSLINGYTDMYYFKKDLEIVLNLIQEQQKEIEKAKEEKDNWKKSYYKLKEETSKIANEINR